MSGNPKQPPAGGPQTQRYQNSPYQPIPPQNSFSVIGAEFPVAAQPGSYVPQAQGPNQGQGLRGIAPAAPPNQASTPPNTDIKVQGLQTAPMNQMFVQNPQVRTQPGTYYQRAAPPSQAQRMPNQQRPPQPLYPSFMMPPTQYFMPSPVANMYTQRQNNFVQQTLPQVYAAQPITSFTSYANPNQPQQFFFNNMLQTRPVQQAGGVAQNAAAAGQLPAGVPQMVAAPAQPPPAPHPSFPMPGNQVPHNKTRPPKKRCNAIPIIDPATGQDIAKDIYNEQAGSRPPSGESSASQTPQPDQQAFNKDKEQVQAEFAIMVAQRAQDDHGHDAPPLDDASDAYQAAGPPVVLAPHANFDIVHNSNLQINAKEFVSTAKMAAPPPAIVQQPAPPPAVKETPIVSANSDAVEVILPNKNKDRESPARIRKQSQREQVQAREEVPKQQQWPSNPEKQEKQPSPPKEEKQADLNANVPAATVQPVVTPAPVASPPPATPIPAKEAPKESAPPAEKKKGKNAAAPEPKANVEQTPIPVAQAPAVQQVAAPQAAPEVTQNVNSAKSKHNAQKNKQAATAATAAAPANNSSKPSVPVPAPQPAKPNNRTNKKSDLNQKGASKEGTDMDAFNDNAFQKEVNANVKAPTQNDVANANTAPPAVTVPVNVAPVNSTPTKMVPATAPSNNNSNNSNNAIIAETNMNNVNETKAPESNEPTVTIKPEIKIKSTEGFDVMSIVKDVPAQPLILKPMVPQNVTPAENTDETDRALVNNEASDNFNNKNSGDGNNKLPYDEVQWAPFRPDGKKAYSRQFLMMLRTAKESKKRPPNILDAVFADERSRVNDVRHAMGGGRTDFSTPLFPSYGSKSSSQRGPMVTKRNSQSKLGPGGGGGGGQGGKSSKPIPKVSISLREDVKLHETENAWKPARFVKGENMSDEDKKTELLYKKVRSVLNKLTPQKFETLLNQVRALEVDSKERLQGVIDLIFDKAVEEPNFSVAYALMCKELQSMQVQADEKKGNFRTLLITRCQNEFEKQTIDESDRNKMLSDIAACTDPDKKKELNFELEEYDRRLRMKSVGIIRFIGELFKQSMLTVNIMKRCLQTLLANKDEESLECLCKLMTTVGKELESKHSNDLESFFKEIKELINGSRQKISSRIRFMLQDVVDLRSSNWVPRRQDFNPKTIDQIQREADKEQLNIQVMNSVPMTPRKDDRGGRGSERKGRNNANDDGWMDVGPKSTRNSTFTVQSDKLKNRVPQQDEPLGSKAMFGTWGKGAGSGFSKQGSQLFNPGANIYAALDNVESDRRQPLGNSSRRSGYSSKGPSLERSSFNKYGDGRNSRSGSQHRPADVGPPSRGGGPPQAPVAAPTPVPAPRVQEAPSQPPAEEPRDRGLPVEIDEQMERRLNNTLEEYLTGSCSVDEYFQEVEATVALAALPRVVEDSILKVMEKSEAARLKTGKLFSQLVKAGKIPLNDFCLGVENIVAQADDLKIDLPKIWDYYAQTLADSVCNEVLSIDRLHQTIRSLNGTPDVAKVLAPLFKLVVSEKGPNFLQAIWQQSTVHLGDFLPSDQVDSFIKNNNLDFLSGGNTPVGQTQLSWDQIQNKLSEFLRNKASFDDIVNWTSANVGSRVEDKKFIRTLATAIFENSINKNKLNPDSLAEHYTLLLKYVDNKSKYELECLYALQALIHKMEHPQGLLLAICDKLYEDSTFSQESFISWETSMDPAEQEGKGVALKQLTSFFTQMKENDEEEEDDYGSTSDEA